MVMAATMAVLNPLTNCEEVKTLIWAVVKACTCAVVNAAICAVLSRLK